MVLPVELVEMAVRAAQLVVPPIPLMVPVRWALVERVVTVAWAAQQVVPLIRPVVSVEAALVERAVMVAWAAQLVAPLIRPVVSVEAAQVDWAVTAVRAARLVLVVTELWVVLVEMEVRVKLVEIVGPIVLDWRVMGIMAWQMRH